MELQFNMLQKKYFFFKEDILRPFLFICIGPVQNLMVNRLDTFYFAYGIINGLMK